MHYKDGPRPRLFAHRGASGTAPENTLAAFAAALAEGADRLEMDVHLTRDLEVVVFHDEDLERTTNGSGPIANLSLSEIKALDAGYRFTDPDGSHPFRGRGIKIPTFVEVLTAFPNTPLNVELKVDEDALVSAMHCLIDGHRAEERLLLTAESGPLMAKIRKRMPKVLSGMCLPESLEFFTNGGNPGYHARGFALQVPTSFSGVPVITPHFIKVAHGCGLEVHAWVINEKPEMMSLIEIGVDGIMTDFPEVCAKILGRSPKQ